MLTRKTRRATTSLFGKLLGILVVVATLFDVGAPAPAIADDQAEGRRRFKRGQDLYKEERYLEAAREFEAGYAASLRPLFLLNIGHSYRRAGELQKAKEAYEQLLRLDPNVPQRPEIEAHLRAIEDTLPSAGATRPRERPATSSGQTAAPPAPPIPSSQPDLTVPPPASTDSATLVASSTRDADRADRADGDSVFRKPWFWVVVAGVVTAGAVAGYVALRGGESCPGTVCFQESKLAK
jgi:tetratricopeptide (TPR) repeat protein